MLEKRPADAAGDVTKRQDQKSRKIQLGGQRGAEDRSGEKTQDQRAGDQQFPSGNACGFQNALATHYGLVLRTTHVTGLLTDLGTNLGMRLRGHRYSRLFGH